MKELVGPLLTFSPLWFRREAVVNFLASKAPSHQLLTVTSRPNKHSNILKTDP
jgi:hypothetical protein